MLLTVLTEIQFTVFRWSRMLKKLRHALHLLKVSLTYIFEVHRLPSASLFSILNHPCFLFFSSVLSEPVPGSRSGSIETIENKAGHTLSFSLADPARRALAFSIISADRQPGAGKCFSVLANCYFRFSSI